NRIAFIEFEDFTGTFSAIAFSDPLKAYVDTLVPDAMVLVGGTLSNNNEAEPKLLLDRALPLDQATECLARAVMLDVMDQQIDEPFIGRIREIGKKRPGDLKTILRVGLRDGAVVRVELPGIKLPGTRETLEELEEIAGEGGVRLHGSWGAAPVRRPERRGPRVAAGAPA
ncbi:MAG TPA: hypothetical protein VKU85_07420, partial [bacterium]|nr:hypothetical protein [bacterium]